MIRAILASTRSTGRGLRFPHRCSVPPMAVVIAVAGLALRLSIAPSLGYRGVDGDLIEHKQAMHAALTRGIHTIYVAGAGNDPALTGRDWDGGYFTNQPPLIYYLRYPLVAVYRRLSPSGFEQWSEELNYLALEKTDLRSRLEDTRGFTTSLKLPGILADLAITLGLARFVGGRCGARTGLLAAAAYAFNPGIVFDTAFWGQHDAVAAGLTCLSLALIGRGRLEGAWAAYALAILAKPQAGAFAVLLVALGLTGFPPRRVARAALAGLATVLLVSLPFIWQGTLLRSTATLWRSTVGGEPFVSCNASNLWWIVARGEGYRMSDGVRVLGLRAQTLGLLATLASSLVAVHRLRVGSGADASRIFLAAAVSGMSFFMLTTELHENHMMAVVPLVAFALPCSRRLWILLALLSLTFVSNMALFDPAVVDPLERAWGRAVPVRGLSLSIAAVNLLALLGLWAIHVRCGEAAPPGLGGAPRSGGATMAGVGSSDG